MAASSAGSGCPGLSSDQRPRVHRLDGYALLCLVFTGGCTLLDETTESGNPNGDPAYCAEVNDWQDAWAKLETEILQAVNTTRAQGATCGSQTFPAAPPLGLNLALRCAARKHSKDMVERNFFEHDNPDGTAPITRMQFAGYDGQAYGENIAAGSSTAAATMKQWMDSSGHCANIMESLFTELGVGYFPGGQYGHVWTQDFGAR